MDDGIDRSPKGLAESLKSPAFNLARERMKKRAAQLKQAGVPHNGIWYWLFLAPEWKLFTWDFPVRDKVDFLHVQAWPDLVRFHLAPHYKLSPEATRLATELPYAFPRGRVTSENDLNYFFIRHGEDTPVPGGLRQVEGKFNLTAHLLEGMAEEIYDPHETTVKNEKEEAIRLIGANY